MSEHLTDEELRDLRGWSGVEWRGAIDEILALRARVAKLEAALHEIAQQKLDGEMGDDGPWGSNYDFVEGYEQCVKAARAALKDAPK